MHPGGVRSAMDLFDFEKIANLKHPNVHWSAMVNDSFDLIIGVVCGLMIVLV